MKLIDYDDTGLPIYDVDLQAPPDDRWKQIARKESKNIGRLLDDVVDVCVEQADRFPAYIRPVIVAVGKGTATLAGRLANTIAGAFGEEYVAEIRSIAKHSGQPLSRVMLGNLTYDLCQMGDIAGFGCSSYSCNVNGEPALGRNMDWIWPKSTGRHSRLIRFHRGNKHYLSVSVLGCVGVLSAICPGNWAVTVNQAPTAGTKTGLLQWPVLQRLRWACDRLSSYRDLVADLQEYRTMSSFFAHVIGTQPTQHTVITGLGNDFKQRRIKGDSLVQTNHFVGSKPLERHNPVKGTFLEDGIPYEWDTYPRLECLHRRLKTVPKTLAEVRRRLQGSPVTFENTMQQMVFQPASSYAKVWLRR
jgi:hypothetical protein